MSLLGALTPLGQVAQGLWFRSVLAYGIGGIVSATAVGIILGSIGPQVSAVVSDGRVLLTLLAFSQSCSRYENGE